MDLLMFTSDMSALQAGSPFEQQLLEYATIGKHLVVIVLTTRHERYVSRRVAKNLWVIPANAPFRLLAPLFALRVAWKQLFFQETLQTDLVVAGDASRAGLAAWIISRRYTKPLVLALFENMIAKEWGSRSFVNYFTMLLARFLVPAADALFTDSEATQRSITKLSQSVATRTTLLPRRIEFSPKKDELVGPSLTTQYPQFKFILLCVAPLRPQYNVRLAITVLAGVLRVYAHTGLVIVGSGTEMGELESYARRIGVRERVVFAGEVEDLSAYYRSAHVLLITSLSEENADTIATAAGLGCVVISTRIGLASLLIENNVSGFLCDPTDPACFVTAIQEMLTHPPTRERVKINLLLSAEKYRSLSTPESRAAAMRKIWEGAIKNFQAFSSGKL